MKQDLNHGMFICFSSQDVAEAKRIVEYLESQGLLCWISVRDVAPGENFQEAIVRAIEAARGLVFLFSENSNTSREIKKELALASSIDRPVFPVRLSPIRPEGALRYELATHQWVDIFEDREAGLTTLVSSIRAVLLAPERAGGSAFARPPTPAAVDPLPDATTADRIPRPLVDLSGAEFEAIRLLLARHIGPIAKIVIQKSANEASTPDDFCQKLASHIPAPSDRAKFSDAVRAQLLAKA